MKILLYDIETSPNIAYIWGKYEQNAVGDFLEERQIICIAWKWLGQKEVYALALPMFKDYKKNPKNNKSLVKKLHNMFNEADIVIGHNVDKFDDKMTNCEFILHGLKPPHPHKTIDTLKVARTKFRFNSNKLDDLGLRLGLGRKVKTGGFDLWLGCLRGNPKSWAKMIHYNKGDVKLLEKIYLILRPWMTNHPNVYALESGSGCPTCGAKQIKLKRDKWMIVGSGRQMRFRCLVCFSWCKGRYTKKNGWKFR